MFALLAPPRCLACAARADLPWCSTCAWAADRLRLGAVHARWPAHLPIGEVSAVYRYRGPVRAAVVAAKARGAWAAWEPLGQLLAGTALPAVDVVTWVPADRRRIRTRGVDHAAVLARPVARALDVPAVRLLDARPGRPDQGRLPVERRRQLDAASFRPRANCADARVLLVDDVLTTGATVRTAAAALAEAAAGSVHVAVLARAGNHPLG